MVRAGQRALVALLCAGVVLAAGCHNNRNASGYGVAWVTLTDSPGDFTSYIVKINSITLTRSDGAVVTALATTESVDFTKLSNYAELWGTATIPVGTYVSATIILDYTSAVISVMVNGLPQQATVVGSNGLAVTTQTIHVILDPASQLTVVPTYATTSAQRLAVDFNLAASTSSINLATTPVTVSVNPYLTVGVAAPDNKMIRVRGPLINSSASVGTYTVYVRPFYDESNSLGSLTLFVDADTLYTINGITSVGAAGITQLTQSSAGSTVTAAYTTYQPTATPSATAGIYHVKYVIAGSTLEDVYTQGLEGDVVARTGNTLTVRGSTLQLNNGTSTFNVADALVIVGPSTQVTADDSAALVGLSSASIAVGQHIIVRGLYSLSASKVVTIDATGASSINTGSVRLIPTRLYGSLVSTAAGSLVLNLQTINQWPVANYAFTGNGASAATDPVAASYLVNTAALAIPDATVGDPVFIDGLVASFGTAPADFNAITVNSELSVQSVGAAAGTVSCGQGTQRCIPASLHVYWTSPGTAAPFSVLTGSGLTINLANTSFASGTIRIGSESIDVTTLPASLQIVPQSGTGAAGLPATYTPLFSYGNPSSVAPLGISVFSVFATFVSGLPAALTAAPALQLEARGTYNRTTNVFSASSVNVVL